MHTKNGALIVTVLALLAWLTVLKKKKCFVLLSWFSGSPHTHTGIQQNHSHIGPNYNLIQIEDNISHNAVYNVVRISLALKKSYQTRIITFYVYEVYKNEIILG